MPFFIKKICHVENSNNFIIIRPTNLSLNDLCFAKGKHNCTTFDTKDIFDFRAYILNNYIKKPINFYLHLLDEYKNIINIEAIDGYSYIYTFNRKKIKSNKLEYYPYINKNVIEIYDNLLDIGNSSLINHNMIAYETISCFKNYFSKNGGGFFGFKLQLNTNIKPHYAVLYGYEEKVTNYIGRFINVQQSEDSESSIEEISLDDSQYVQNIPSPTAELFNITTPEPSAPPLPGSIN